MPLQKEARQSGNSVFLDQNLVPHVDQWSFLATVQKISVQRVEDVVSVAERQGRVVGIRLVVLEEEDETPWKIPPSRRRKAPAIIGTLPVSLELVLANEIFISKDALPPALRYRLFCLAAFQNPDFCKAQAMRFPTYDKPRIIACAEDHTHHIGLPRGCLEEVTTLLSDLNIEPVIRDERYVGTPLELDFQGQLRA